MRRSLFAGLVFVVACSSSSSSPTTTTTNPTAVETPSPSADGTTPPTEPGAPGTTEQPQPQTPQGPFGPAEVLLVGRFDLTDPKAPKASWPGSRILTRFEGTQISATFHEHAFDWMEGAPSYWEVSIDHGDFKPIAMIADGQPHVFELAKDLPAGPHDVELYKRSETQTGTTQFLGFDLHGGKPLPPPARQNRRIEVMGDSFASGFGVENIDSPNNDCPGPDWGGVWENFRKSWGALLGTTFDAEVHGIVYSGKGLVKNIWTADTDPLKDYYPRADPNPQIAGSAPMFDLQSWIPDVIVLTQGSCDIDAGVPDGEFKAAYRDFVINTLRARGPNTHIFMGTVGVGARSQVADAAAAIIAERQALGDTKLHAFQAKPYTWDEMTACNGHGTPTWHKRIATELAEEIRGKLGW